MGKGSSEGNSQEPTGELGPGHTVGKGSSKAKSQEPTDELQLIFSLCNLQVIVSVYILQLIVFLFILQHGIEHEKRTYPKLIVPTKEELATTGKYRKTTEFPVIYLPFTSRKIRRRDVTSEA